MRLRNLSALLVILVWNVLFGLNVELQVKECAKVGVTDGFPISVVVPLPYGVFQDCCTFRLTDESGTTVPAQFIVLNRNWLQDRSIANIRVDFQPTVSAYSGSGTGISKYYLKDDGTGNSAVTPLTVDENSDLITVVTGPLKFTVNKKAFNLIDELWLDKDHNGTFESTEKIIASSALNGGVFKPRAAAGGLQYDAARNDVSVQVEETGPMRIVIKAEALTYYNSTIDHKHGYGVRIYAYAGKPYVKIDYQLRNSAKNKLRGWPLYFESMNLDFRLTLGDNPVIRIGTGDAQVYQRTRDKGLFLAQDSAIRYNVRDLASNASLSTGPKCAGYFDVNDGATGVAAMTRFFWQMWPNGLGIDSTNKLQVQLFPEWCSEWSQADVGEFPVTYYPLHLYWLEDMQFVYKEVLLTFHDGSLSPEALNKLARTLEYPPVAVVPTSWFGETRSTFDMGGIFPLKQKVASVDSARVPVIKTDFGMGAPEMGWDWFGGIRDGRRKGTSGVGGWPLSYANYTATENPLDYYKLEQYALGELNVRPFQMAGYDYNKEFSTLQLGTNSVSSNGWRSPMPFDVANYRMSHGGWTDTAYLAQTEPDSRARDYSHMWYYLMNDAYFITGNPWIRDWYGFMGEMLKSQVDTAYASVNPIALHRANGHAVSNALNAYRVTGDEVGYDWSRVYMMRMGRTVNRLTGFGSDANWMTGFCMHAMADYLSCIEYNIAAWQKFVDVYQVLAGQMEFNYNFANFSYTTSDLQPSSSSGSGSCMLDPVAWYYLHSGKKKYLDHALKFINSGINNGTKPYYGEGGNWSGEYYGRTMKYVRDNPKTDVTPPAAVADLAATRADSTLTLTWTAPSDAKRYMIFWSDRVITEESTLDTGTMNWWAAKGVGPAFFATPGAKETYSFTVPVSGALCVALFSFDSAFNLSSLSNLAFVDRGLPGLPGNLQAVSQGNHQVSLTWSAAASASGIRNYIVYRNGVRIAETISLSYLDFDAREGCTDTFEVAAVNRLLQEGSKAKATVALPADLTAPGIASIWAVNTVNEVRLTFDEKLDSLSAVAISNYTLSGGRSVTAARLDSSGRRVTLTCNALAYGTTYTLTINGVKDRSAAANAVSGLQQAFTYREPFVITGTFGNTSLQYDLRWDTLELNEYVYVDDDGVVLSAPNAYLHMPMLRTTNDNQLNAKSQDQVAMSFTVNKEVMIYIAYSDSQRSAGRTPSWLSGFTDTGDDILTYSIVYPERNTKQPRYSLYQKKYAAGKIELYGNNGASTYRSNYFVIVIPTDSSFVPVIPIQVEENAGEEFCEGESIFPNPFNPVVTIVAAYRLDKSLANQPAPVRIFDIRGALVAEVKPVSIRYHGVNAVTCRYQWEATGAASGVYLVRITDGSGKVRHRTIMLMK